MNVLQKQLLEFADDAPAYETFTLMSYLNTLVQNLDALMDPSEFISKPIFPILSPTGESKRVCGDTNFFIVDDMRLFNLFRDRTNMLAFTRSQVMRIDPLFKWLNMQKRYLTLQAKYAVDWPCEGKLRKIEWDIGQKAEALLRIAAYFRSCRTENDFDRNELLQSLRHAIMIEVEDMFSETELIVIDTRDSQHSAGEPSNVVKDTYPQLKLTNSESRRVIAYVAADKKQQELAIAVALPRLLMEWLMIPLNYYDGGRGGRVNIPELGVSPVKSALNAPPELGNDILEVEGIEQPFPIQQDRRGAPENEECLDQVETDAGDSNTSTNNSSRTPLGTGPCYSSTRNYPELPRMGFYMSLCETDRRAAVTGLTTVTEDYQVTFGTVRVELGVILNIGVPPTTDNFGGAGVLSRKLSTKKKPSLKQLDSRFDLRYVAESTIALLIKHKDVSPQAAELSDTLPTLYYSLSRVCLRDVFISDPEIASNSKYIRDQFEKHSLLWHHGWRSPSECCINDKEKTIKKFYENVLLIWQPENTWRTAIRELEYQRAREASASIDDVSFLYYALQRMTDPFSFHHASPGEGQEEEQRIIDSKKAIIEEEREFVRAAFYSQSWIAVEHNKGVKWLRRVDCIWKPHHNHTGKVDLSGRYDNVINFLFKIINVERFPREVYEVSPIPPDPALLRRRRAALVDVDGTILANIPSDPHEALTSNYFPVYTTASSVELMPADDYFLIADDLMLEIMFRDQVPMLVPNKMKRLETDFEWLEMTYKYISNNVIERLIWPTGAKQRKLDWDIAEKAEAIVSIAAHFQSPRARNTLARRKLLTILKEGEIFAVEGAELMAGLFTTAPGSYSMGPCFNNEQGFVAPSTRLPVSVSITDSGMTLDKLVVHISADGADIRRAYGDGLPMRLLHWLMVNPETMRLNQKLSGRAQTILRSVLCTPPDLVNAILEEKKIKLVRDLDLPTGLSSEELESKATPTSASNTISMTPDSSTPADSPSDQHPHQHSPEVTTAVPKTGPIETPVTQAASSEQFHMEFKPSTTTQRRFLVPKSRRSTPHSPEEAVPASPTSSDNPPWMH
ncbi:hypothetical protein FMEXI_777 [Fusarium mexicanum]|uniref:Uncharacterized protein n=1 Tax=Fusarium mexicanum TaxID=751941 RepID=A0A8H5NA53_9HYPO|nr:hypothetical protein FMEXI_777 [Fusarium mexicanum]